MKWLSSKVFPMLCKLFPASFSHFDHFTRLKPLLYATIYMIYDRPYGAFEGFTFLGPCKRMFLGNDAQN